MRSTSASNSQEAHEKEADQPPVLEEMAPRGIQRGLEVGALARRQARRAQALDRHWLPSQALQVCITRAMNATRSLARLPVNAGPAP
jgi:hypothetical protein